MKYYIIVLILFTIQSCASSAGEHLRQSQQGWTVVEIQQFRGHSNLQSTRRYLDGHDYVTIDMPAISS